MLDAYGFEIYEQNEFPLAYLITFRTYGTWLHGDERWAVRRNRKSRTETKMVPPNVPLEERMKEEFGIPPFVLSMEQRQAVEEAIREVCRIRGYVLRGVNVRTNHVHSVISVQAKPERVADSLKAYSTRWLRELGLIEPGTKVWSRGRSRRYPWKPRHVDAAVDYVLYGQGEFPFELEN